MNNKQIITEKLNFYGSQQEPFFFMIDYELQNYHIQPLSALDNDIHFVLNNTKFIQHNNTLTTIPISYKSYKIKFDQLQNEIQKGNCYLANLTTKTPISTPLSLKQIYLKANAKYKLYYKDKFISFSPEQFVNISNNKIYTYPMKGTIDATIPNAKELILSNQKELAEHTMVVDLLRNDLSMIASNVKVDKFRYIDTIQAGTKQLLQVSSKISGNLTSSWHKNIGNILTTMLPAGSITGTPKKRCIEILNLLEDYKREYFTGIFGIYDGNILNSAIMIRFIQKESNKLYYKSGGGITSDSCPDSEYEELNSKIYIP